MTLENIAADPAPEPMELPPALMLLDSVLKDRVHPSVSEATLRHVTYIVTGVLAEAAWQLQELTDWYDAHPTYQAVPGVAINKDTVKPLGDLKELDRPENGKLEGPPPHPEWADISVWLTKIRVDHSPGEWPRVREARDPWAEAPEGEA